MADTPADPNRGAAGTEVQTFLALRNAGHEVDAIWAGDLGQRIRHPNLHLLLELPREYERAAIEALQRKPYDVLHVNQPHGYRAARAVHRRWPHPVFVHRSHGFELNVEDTLRPWRKKLERDERPLTRRMASTIIAPLVERHSYAIARRADGHVVSSSLDARYLIERLRVAPERLATIANAAPNAYIRTAAPPITAERLQHVLYVGQFAFVKGPMVTAEAINRIAEARHDVRFTWVCDRSHHPHVRALLSSAANERTALLHWMPQEELVAVYDSAGVFLFPSLYEGFGKAFLEAMARGLCVVASSVGGAVDLITTSSDGMLVPPGDGPATAAAALALIGDQPRARQMGETAARTARNYTWARTAAELTAFYGRLMSLPRMA